ncbi:GNAT family N-acetyltransferase [Pedobacter sp. Hv1]|uniref:GNAT family N-acetyltransferase n=1 Tax=Pedobacter sp. Hv1 TaxID=1740090 RepID=UPI0006D89776|nr:GNAT family N-acetyltransferase [Pedobacter sp. Hv1]KQC00862.1 hypothetical protein AQF98_09300 [Pedobacter sp. Hv1]
MQNITYRPLEAKELVKFQEIDRTEYITEIYAFENGQLILKPEPCLAGAFEPDELQNLIAQQQMLLTDGGEVIGAFNGDRLVGITSVEHNRRGKSNNYCKMDILYVSNAFRGKRIGHYLVQECKTVALSFGAAKLYISATPTKATVDFYLNLGATLVKEIDPQLFELEPLDIHLELQVQ